MSSVMRCASRVLVFKYLRLVMGDSMRMKVVGSLC